MHGTDWGGMGWWGMGWMWIFWVSVLIVVALLIRWIVISARGSKTSHDSPEKILKMRYARGEIDREEYVRRLEDLRR